MKHYYQSRDGRLCAQDIIDEFGLNFNLGNVIKYIIRAGRKKGETRAQALEKALYYLAHEEVLAEHSCEQTEEEELRLSYESNY